MRKCQLDPFFFPVLQTRAAKNAGSADCFKFRISSFKRPAVFKHNDNKNNNNYSYHRCQAYSGQAFTCTVLYKSHQDPVAAIIFSKTISPSLQTRNDMAIKPRFSVFQTHTSPFHLSVFHFLTDTFFFQKDSRQLVETQTAKKNKTNQENQNQDNLRQLSKTFPTMGGCSVLKTADWSGLSIM